MKTSHNPNAYEGPNPPGYNFDRRAPELGDVVWYMRRSGITAQPEAAIVTGPNGHRPLVTVLCRATEAQTTMAQMLHPGDPVPDQDSFSDTGFCVWPPKVLRDLVHTRFFRAGPEWQQRLAHLEYLEAWLESL